MTADRFLHGVCVSLVVLLSSAAAVQANQLEVSPSLAMGKPAGDGSENFGLDVGAAAALGARLHPNFSMNLRVAFDRLAPDDPPLVDASMWMARLQLNPAAHVVQERVDFSLGPTFGVFYQSVDVDVPGPTDAEGSARGFVLGALVTLMFRANADFAVGPFFAYDRLFPTNSCVTVGSMPEQCEDDPDDDAGFWQIGVSARF